MCDFERATLVGENGKRESRQGVVSDHMCYELCCSDTIGMGSRPANGFEGIVAADVAPGEVGARLTVNFAYKFSCGESYVPTYPY